MLYPARSEKGSEDWSPGWGGMKSPNVARSRNDQREAIRKQSDKRISVGFIWIRFWNRKDAGEKE